MIISPELLTPAEMAEVDRLTIASGISGMALMEAAGQAVADVAANKLDADHNRVVVLCGPGNNGGDGFIAARVLRDKGFAVTLGLLGAVDALIGDAAQAAKLWNDHIAPLNDVDLSSADLVIDALLGAGLARDLDGDVRACVERMNEWTQATGRPIIAVDVPTGLDGHTGQVRGVAVQARETVTFFRFKPGHLLFPGKTLCGVPHLADIGISSEVISRIRPDTFANAPSLWRHLFPVPTLDGHKYTRGHAVILSGDVSHTGAARLAARGALRGGAGLVTVASPSAALNVNAAQLTAIMLTTCEDQNDLEFLLSDVRKNSCVLGPGLGIGHRTHSLVLTALRCAHIDAGIVLDADALTSFADDLATLCTAIANSKANVILTPHEGEFARLFGESSRNLAKTDRVRKAAQISGATVLLKGPDTVVADLDGRASIAFASTPWLATAGSGDVLCGFISALLAQGMPAFEAASAAVWLHGECGHLAGPGLIAEDLPEMLPKVLRRLLG